jgi:hypothetical protein
MPKPTVSMFRHSIDALHHLAPQHVHKRRDARMRTDTMNSAATPAPHNKSPDCQDRSAAWRGAAAWAVVSVWLAGTGYAFWSFELGQQRSFESPRTVLFDSGTRARSAEAWFRASIAPLANGGAPAAATVVHVYMAGCICNRFTHAHLARIVTRYRSAGVNFFAAMRPAAGGGVAVDTAPKGLPRIALPAGNELSWIEATPAALVYDANGKLVYFGPYSDSARCGESGGLVERVLDRVLLGHPPHPQPFYGGGCFCGEKKES